MTTRIPSSAADLLRALCRLDPRNKHTQAAIAATLGWTPAETAPPSEISSSLFAPPDDGETLAFEEAQDGALDEAPEMTGHIADVPLASRLTEVTKAEAAGLHWLANVDPLPEPQRKDQGAPAGAPPLFRTGQTRGILAALLSSSLPRGDLDLDEIVRAVAEARALTVVPRLPTPSHARGVQLLVDRSETMMPFTDDVTGLTAWVKRVAYQGGLEVLRFAACPLRGAGRGPRSTWKDYRAQHTPPPGTRVVALTDLGLGRAPGGASSAAAEEWLGFAEHMRRSGLPFVAVVPYGPGRWLPKLARRIPILPWHERTNAALTARVVHGPPGAALRAR